MIYQKPSIRTVKISAPPLAANFSPPPISIVPPRGDHVQASKRVKEEEGGESLANASDGPVDG